MQAVHMCGGAHWCMYAYLDSAFMQGAGAQLLKFSILNHYLRLQEPVMQHRRIVACQTMLERPVYWSRQSVTTSHRHRPSSLGTARFTVNISIAATPD